MRYIKSLNEMRNSHQSGVFVGYHCSNNTNLETETNYRVLGTNDYFEFHEEILISIADKYPEANEYLEKVEEIGADTGFWGELTTEISEFLKGLGICGIFINNSEPNKRWGNNCYEVFFDHIEFDPIQDIILLEEEGDENSYLYIFGDSKPKFLKS